MGGLKSLKMLHNLLKTTTFITNSWKNLRGLLVVICICDKMGRETDILPINNSRCCRDHFICQRISLI